MLTFLVACILLVIAWPIVLLALALLGRAAAALVPLACLAGLLIYFAR